MRLRFLGGAREYGRNGCLLETGGTRVLLDYGISPSDPPEYPEPAPHVDGVFLSHAHLDHSGMLPWVAHQHNAPIHATPISQAIAELLARDSLKICKIEGYPYPYRHGAIRSMMDAFVDTHYGEGQTIGNLDVDYQSAGHIPGSQQILLNDGERTTCYTGDLNIRDSRLVEGARAPRCDTLIVESCYAGRNHPEREEVEDEFLDAVAGVIGQGGQVIVPAFATGRTQEMLMLLLDQGYDVAVDGMGRTICEFMLDNPDTLRDPSGLKRAFQRANIVRSRADRRRVLDENDIVITTSGMVEGGPVLGYLEDLRDDPKSAVFLTGYQADDTGGRRLLERGEVEVAGVFERVACEIRYFNFSAHAGHEDLVDFIIQSGCDDVVFFHSDDPKPLADDVKEHCDVHLPGNGEWVEV